MTTKTKISCPHIEGCSLHPLLNLESSLKVWQTIYCKGNFEKCSRFQRSQCGETTPAHLLPDGTYLGIGSCDARVAPGNRRYSFGNHILAPSTFV